MPPDHPCTTGSTMKPSPAPAISRAATVSTLHRRHEASRAAPGSIAAMLARPVDVMNNGPRRGRIDELANRPAIGNQHQQKDERVPQGEPVQRSGQPDRRVKGNGMSRRTLV